MKGQVGEARRKSGTTLGRRPEREEIPTPEFRTFGELVAQASGEGVSERHELRRLWGCVLGEGG